MSNHSIPCVSEARNYNEVQVFLSRIRKHPEEATEKAVDEYWEKVEAFEKEQRKSGIKRFLEETLSAALRIQNRKRVK